jgi:hypothetical protein
MNKKTQIKKTQIKNTQRQMTKTLLMYSIHLDYKQDSIAHLVIPRSFQRALSLRDMFIYL